MDMKPEKYEDKAWYDSDGKYHREDGPAIEYASGNRICKWK